MVNVCVLANYEGADLLTKIALFYCSRFGGEVFAAEVFVINLQVFDFPMKVQLC